MNRTRLLMIGVLALAAGLLVALFVYKNLQPKTGVPADMAQVMVAASDLQVGARVEERDIKVIQIPSTELPPGAPRRKADVIGRGVILPIPKGDFILSNNLAGENAGAGLPALIPPGMRAVSVRVNEVISVAGFVTPGTRVDVLLTGSPSGGNTFVAMILTASATCRQQKRHLLTYLTQAVSAYRDGNSAPSLLPV